MKKKRVILFICILPILLWAQSCERNNDQDGQKKAIPPPPHQYEGVIVALGDSLTAGLGVDLDKNYPSLLEKRLKSEGYTFRVVNAGVSGETSSGTLSRINWILSQRADIVVLEIGANDGLRGIDPSLVENNIRKILQRLKEHDSVIVLAGMKMVMNLGSGYTDNFNSIYPQLAQEFGVLFMPFFLEDVATDPELNGSDGIHPNEKGYAIITKNIYPYIVDAIEEYRKRRKDG